MQQFGASMFDMVVRWHKLGEAEIECTLHNVVVLAINMPTIINVSKPLTKLWQKNLTVFSETRCTNKMDLFEKNKFRLLGHSNFYVGYRMTKSWGTGTPYRRRESLLHFLQWGSKIGLKFSVLAPITLRLGNNFMKLHHMTWHKVSVIHYLCKKTVQFIYTVRVTSWL